MTVDDRLTGLITTQITYVFIDVEEGRHGGVVDGSQIWLVPVDVEHSSYSVAARSVAGHVLQQKRLLTTGRQTESKHRFSDWPFLQVIIWKKWSASNFSVPLGCLEPGSEQREMIRKSFLPGAVITSTEQDINECYKILYSRFFMYLRCAWIY